MRHAMPVPDGGPPATRVALLALSALAAACGGVDDGAPAAQRADSAGVEIVTSPAEDRPLDWTFREAFALGGADAGPESFYRLHPALVGTDAAGRIHVLHGVEHRVVTFGPDGALLRERGREGAGPGELESPAFMSVRSSGEVSVFDYGKLALVRWDSAGELLPEIPFPHAPMGGGRHHALTDDGYIASAGALVDDERVNRLLRVAGEDTTVLAQAPSPNRGYIMFDRCGGGINFPPLFTHSVVWDHRAGTTAVVPGPDYRVDLRRDGRLVRSLRRDLPVTEATRELAIAEAGDGFTIDFGRGPCTVPPGEYVDARGWAGTVPAIRRIALAPDGAVWVERWVPGADPMPVDIFGPDGAYVGTVADGPGLPAVLFGDRRVGVIRTDELDVARLVVGDLAPG